MPISFYTHFVADYYDLFFTPDEQELAFWQQLITASPAPALELGVGTGRILLPLLARGLQVEGVDCSAIMLAHCMRKATAAHLQPILYEQYIQTLQLPHRYGCIFSPVGTWQQITDRAAAQQALQRIRAHLVPGGRLALYTYLPWYNAPEFGQWHTHAPVQIAADETLCVSEKAIHDPVEQMVYSTYGYARYKHDVCVSVQEKELAIRWYSRFELQMMLEQAGFADIQIYSGYDNTSADVMILICSVT